MKINTNKKKTGTYRADRDKPTLKGSVVQRNKSATDSESIKDAVLELINDYGLSHSADSLLIDAFCIELEVYHNCMKQVKEEGVVISFVNGKQEMRQINPAYKAAKIALDNAMKIGKDFGLTTKSRALMAEHLVQEVEEHDPLDNLMP